MNYQDEKYGLSLAEAYAEAAASAPVDLVVMYTYEITHSTFGEDRILIVNDFQPLKATLEDGSEVTFVPCPVQVTAPEQSDSGASPSINVQIDGVSALLAGRLDAAMGSFEKIGIVERVYVSSDTSAPAIIPPLSLVLQDVEVNETSVTATAAYDDPVNRGFPTKDYNIRQYPGLSAR